MTATRTGAALLGLILLASATMVHASASLPLSISSRVDRLVADLQPTVPAAPAQGSLDAITLGDSIRIEGCADYPYHETRQALQGYLTLASDLRDGLHQGLQCLTGQGPMGSLHPYHLQQALRLIDILENEEVKTFRCVADQTFAYAVARASPERVKGDHFDAVTRDLPYPGVVLDTYRISGFLTRKHTPETYREFFKLDERLVEEHLNGKPQRIDGLHRFKDRPALLFHEMTHWLGHVHTAIQPDVVELYEACCFSGDDHIGDEDEKRRFQLQACNILRDAELWQANPYRQMRLWRYKGYDRFKREMRDAYD